MIKTMKYYEQILVKNNGLSICIETYITYIYNTYTNNFIFRIVTDVILPHQANA